MMKLEMTVNIWPKRIIVEDTKGVRYILEGGNDKPMTLAEADDEVGVFFNGSFKSIVTTLIDQGAAKRDTTAP